jgi:lysophospholipase L1-like esterase
MSLLVALPSWAVPIKILPLGDSITNGSENGGNELAYRDDLYQTLTDAGYDFKFVGSCPDSSNTDGKCNLPSLYDPSNLTVVATTGTVLKHEGRSSITADEMAFKLPVDWLPSYDVDVALLHIGTNDIYNGETPDSTLADIELIITALKAKNTAMKILVAKVLPMGSIASNVAVTGTTLNGTDYSAGLNALLNPQWAAAKGVTLVDQYNGITEDELLGDLVHPNPIGEKEMSNRWFAALANILPAPAVTTPPVISNMTLHLDASDADGNGVFDILASDKDITQWHDKSGNNNHVTNTTATKAKQLSNGNGKNGKPVIGFGGSAGLQTQSNGQITTNGPYTKFVVFKYDTTSGPNNLVSSNVFATTLWGNGTTNIIAMHSGNESTDSMPTKPAGTNYHRASYRYDPAGAGNRLNLDNNLGVISSSVVDHPSSDSKTSIGSIGDTNFLNGKIAEVIIYNRGLTNAEVGQVETYLELKWFGTDTGPTLLDPSLTITSAPIATVGTAYEITKTSDSSSGAITYSVAPASVCTHVGTAVTMIATGTCTITATQAVAAGYTADTATLPVIVSTAPVVSIDPSLSVTSSATATVGTAYTIAKSSQSSGAITYSVAPASVCTNVGTAVTMKATGTCTITATQAVAPSYTADTATKSVAVSAAPVVDTPLSAITDIITGKSTKPITIAQLKALGIKNVKSGIDYTKALKAYSYADQNKPSKSEIQKAVDKANKDSIKTGGSGGGSISPAWLLLLGAIRLMRRKVSFLVQRNL